MTPTALHDWSIRHHVSLQALQELHVLFTTVATAAPDATSGTSESDVQTQVRLGASKQGNVLWRNNVGVLPDVRGVPVRFGLCNDSKQLNDKCKSSDTIGIKQVLVTQAHVGHTIGQFYAREVKRAGWRYTGTPREIAQLRFIEAVVAMGGDAGWACGDGDL